MLITLTLLVCVSTISAQDAGQVEVTKEFICKGAAVSVVWNVKPWFERDFSKEKTVAYTKDLVKAPIKDAPAKAYDLFKANKTVEEITEILYNDFMKLDKKVVMQFLITDDDY